MGIYEGDEGDEAGYARQEAEIIASAVYRPDC